MSIYKRLVAFAVLIAVCEVSFAQTLWRETVYGMGPDEVMKLVPEAVPVTVKRGTLNSGAEELLRIDGVEIVNEKFTASFYFKDQKLVQVMLSLESPKSFPTSLRVFDTLTEALRAKYGQELSRKVSRTPFPHADATWLSGRTNIGVWLMAVDETHVRLNINYQVRLTREADKL